MPTFCRHNRFIQNCPICAGEQAERQEAPGRVGRRSATTKRPGAGGTVGSRRSGGFVVRQAARSADDGYRSSLVPGIKSRADAERLAEALARAAVRLAQLASDPPGLYAEVGAEPDLEEATWLAFLIAYLGPLEGEEPFAGVRAARTSWASGELPQLEGVPLGPRGAHDPARGTATLTAYRAWAGRARSQAAAFTGEPAWTSERRFARTFERLALPGFSRPARFELLVTLGRLGRYDLRAGALHLGGTDETAVAAKRVFGIGDPLLLERRAADLAATLDVPLDALDSALEDWGVGRRGPVAPEARDDVARALGL